MNTPGTLGGANKAFRPSIVPNVWHRRIASCQSSSGIISKELLDTMDGPTAFAAGNYYLDKAYNDASSTEDNTATSSGAPPGVEREAGKAVLKEIRMQIKAQRRKLQQAGSSTGANDTSPDPRRMASELYYHALDREYYPAAVALGNMFLLEDPPNRTEAYALYKKAADESENPDALYNLGQMSYDDGDLDQAFLYFERAAAEDDPSALFWLGYSYHRGVYYAPSSSNAMDFLCRAGEAGHNGARVYLAQAFRSGDKELGIETPNASEMWRWLNMAVEDKDPEAIFILADMHFHGSDEQVLDYERALQLYLEAGDLSHAPSLCSAAAMYYHGLGMPSRDFHTSFCMYQAAIEIDPNNVAAFRNIAVMHYYGEGVPVDKNMAKVIFDHVKALEEEEGEE